MHLEVNDYVIYTVCKKFQYPAKILDISKTGEYTIMASICEDPSMKGFNLTILKCRKDELTLLTKLPTKKKKD